MQSSHYPSHQLTFNSQDLITSHNRDLISNSPYCLSYNSYDVCLEKLVLDQLIILLLLLFFILVTCLLDLVLTIIKEKFCLGHSLELRG